MAINLLQSTHHCLGDESAKKQYSLKIKMKLFVDCIFLRGFRELSGISKKRVFSVFNRVKTKLGKALSLEDVSSQINPA